MQTDTIDPSPRNEDARLAPTIIGAIVGAAVGIGLHLVLETGVLGTQPYEATWFAIIIGLLTGLGVRQANKGHMGRSYLRGAVSGFLALGAIVLSTFLISKVMEARDATAPSVAVGVQPAAEPAAGADAEADDTPPAPAESEPAIEGATADNPGVRAGRRADELNPWQFVFMALGALVAYELGRGVEPRQHAGRVDREPVIVTDPSN